MALPNMCTCENAALEAVPQAQLMVSLNGTLVLANAQARSLFGINLLDQGRPLQDLEISYRPLELRSPIEEACQNQRKPSPLTTWPGISPTMRRSILMSKFTPSITSEGDTDWGGHHLCGCHPVTTFLQLELQRANQDLETTNEELQSSNEELETTNEELQSTNEELETTNEELQSSNEELETMNEELHSTNEELQTINEELRQRTSELNQANAFLKFDFEPVCGPGWWWSDPQYKHSQLEP
jgi:two-component system CheB/CheR fusion protein